MLYELPNFWRLQKAFYFLKSPHLLTQSPPTHNHNTSYIHDQYFLYVPLISIQLPLASIPGREASVAWSLASWVHTCLLPSQLWSSQYLWQNTQALGSEHLDLNAITLIVLQPGGSYLTFPSFHFSYKASIHEMLKVNLRLTHSHCWVNGSYLDQLI